MKIQHSKKAIKKLKTLVASPNCDINNFREKIDETFSNPFLSNRVQVEQTVINSIACDVLIPEVSSTSDVILYVHGGSFIGGSSKAWRSFCSNISHIACEKLIIPDYRLAPQSPFPAGLNDVKAVVKKLYMESKKITIMADGAGASIALGVLFKIKPEFRKQIKGIYLFSPWLNLSHIIEKKKAKSKDKITTLESIKWSADLYTYSENTKSPFVSPVFATKEDLAGLPPVYIQYAENEIIEEDILDFKKILRRENLPCTLDKWEGMLHMFQLVDEFYEESHLAVEKIAKLIKK